MPLRCKDLIEVTNCLIRAKVDLEYGMGFSKNPYLYEATKEIKKALDLIFNVEDEDYEA